MGSMGDTVKCWQKTPGTGKQTEMLETAVDENAVCEITKTATDNNALAASMDRSIIQGSVYEGTDQ